MNQTDKLNVARTLKDCIEYLVKDCEDAGFSSAAIHLHRAADELKDAGAADGMRAAHGR